MPVNTGLTAAVGEDILALAVDPSATATLYAGTTNGLFKSTDSGADWKLATAGLTNRYVRALVVAPSKGALYAGTQGGGVFKSSDGAASWVPANKALTQLDVRALAIDPSDGNTLYAGASSIGTDAAVFKSTPTVARAGRQLPRE